MLGSLRTELGTLDGKGKASNVAERASDRAVRPTDRPARRKERVARGLMK